MDALFRNHTGGSLSLISLNLPHLCPGSISTKNLNPCTESSCDGVNFLHGSHMVLCFRCEARTMWITHPCVVATAEPCWHSIEAFSFSHSAHPQQVGWRWARGWEWTQLTQTDQGHIYAQQ